MRTIVGFGLALLLTFALAAQARAATAGEGQSALEEANAALAAQPLQRDAARRALERAAADQGAASQAYYRLGILDEEDDEFERALTRYRECLAAKATSSGGHWARNAAKRVQWLSTRSAGNFAPLKRLNGFKRDPALSANPEAVASFARDAEAFPPGIVRSQARTFVAAALLGPLHRPHDAVPVFRQVLTDPAAEGGDLLVASRGLVDALREDGQLDEAVKEAKLRSSQIDAEVMSDLQQRVRRRDLLVRRRNLLHAAWIALAVFVGFVVIALGYARWKRGSFREALRATRRPARVAGALWCAVGAITAVFALIGTLAPTYLERIGL
jgi:tetratricopeptide (TPR) repeat protein